MNVLIVKLSAIGDVILSQPFLAAMRQRFPDARLTWLVEEAAADLVLGHPLLDRVIVSRRKSWVRDLKKGRLLKVFRQVRRFWGELRGERYDLVVDLQGLFKSGILAFLSGGRRRVGFDRTRELSWLFVNERLAPYDPERHALDRYLDVAEHLGARRVSGYVLPPFAEEAIAARDLLEGLARPLVAVNPGAKWRTKLWPGGHWAALVRLLREAGYAVVLTGGPDEADENRIIAQAATGVVDLTGRTSLKTLAELFRAADLVVCPDTGPMHLAAAVGTRVVALFGPTAHWRTGPYGPGHTVICANVDCRPCFLKSCENPACMTGLSPESVMTAVRATLKPHPSDAGRNNRGSVDE